MKFTVQFTGRVKRDDGSYLEQPLALTVDVDESHLAGLEGDAKAHKARELAWDAYKSRSGFRRWPGDVAPEVTAQE